MSSAAVLKMFFDFVGVVCVLASGLTPVYSTHVVTIAPPNQIVTDYQGDCELGVWRTTSSWTIEGNSSDTDMPTYNLPFVQGAWIVPVMETVYTIALVLGIATMVWQVAAARSALLQAKAHWWRHCEWALRLFTALLGGVYLLLVWQFATHFWVAYPSNEWSRVTVHANDAYCTLDPKPGFFVACAGAISLGASLLILSVEAFLTKPAPLKTVAVNPEESQPIVGQVVNKAVYHTCA